MNNCVLCFTFGSPGDFVKPVQLVMDDNVSQRTPRRRHSGSRYVDSFWVYLLIKRLLCEEILGLILSAVSQQLFFSTLVYITLLFTSCLEVTLATIIWRCAEMLLKIDQEMTKKRVSLLWNF